MMTQAAVSDRAGVLWSLIRFEAPLDGIVQILMDSQDEDRDDRHPQPTLLVRDMVRLCARVQRHELSPAELQRWARVVEGMSDIMAESQRLYPILSELATTAPTLDRLSEIQAALVGGRSMAERPSDSASGAPPRWRQGAVREGAVPGQDRARIWRDQTGLKGLTRVPISRFLD